MSNQVEYVSPKVVFKGLGNYYVTDEERLYGDETEAYSRFVRMIEAAALNCYKSKLADSYEKAVEFVKDLGKWGFTSPFEHIQFTIKLCQSSHINRLLDFLIRLGRYRWFDLLKEDYALYLSGNFRVWFETINDIATLQPNNDFGIVDPFAYIYNKFAFLFDDSLEAAYSKYESDLSRIKFIDDFGELPLSLIRLVFYMEVDRAVTMEWDRYKMISISQGSQYYVACKNKSFQSMKIPEFDGDAHVGNSLGVSLKSTAVAYKPKMAHTNCNMTSVYYSALAPFWDCFLKMRLDKHAHPHIRALAEKVADVLGDLEDSKSCGWLFTNLCRS